MLQFLLWSPLFALIVMDFVYVDHGISNVSEPLIDEALWKLSTHLPSNLALLALIATVPIAAAYALLERQFGRSEMYQSSSTFSKTDRFLSRPIPYFHTS